MKWISQHICKIYLSCLRSCSSDCSHFYALFNAAIVVLYYVAYRDTSVNTTLTSLTSTAFSWETLSTGLKWMNIDLLKILKTFIILNDYEETWKFWLCHYRVKLDLGESRCCGQVMAWIATWLYPFPVVTAKNFLHSFLAIVLKLS